MAAKGLGDRPDLAERPVCDSHRELEELVVGGVQPDPIEAVEKQRGREAMRLLPSTSGCEVTRECISAAACSERVG